MASCKDVLRYLYFKRNILILLLAPLLASPLLICCYELQAARCGFVIVILAVLWTTQALPLPVTGFMPLFMYPLLDVLPMARVCEYYMAEFMVLFISVLCISSAVQRHGLHRRIAIRAMLLAGSDPKRLLLAVMIVVGFLSMWILNVALVSMMVPIVAALVDKLSTSDTEKSVDKKDSDEEKIQNGKAVPLEVVIVASSERMEDIELASDSTEVDDTINKSTEILDDKAKAERINQKNVNEDIGTCFILGLAYSAVLGGAATMSGSLLQVVMNVNIEIYFTSEAKITFGNWMLFSAPMQLVSLLLAWAWLSFFYLDLKSSTVKCFRKQTCYSNCCRVKNKGHEEGGIVKVLREEYANMGPMKWAEKTIIFVFLFLILFWFFEEPKFMPGWSDWFTPGYVGASTITAGVALICFALPSRKPKINIHDRKPYEGLLEWKSAAAMVPWGMLIHAGGLLSSVEAIKVSGLADLIGDQFEFVASLQYWLVLLAVTVAASLLTEFMSANVIMAVTIPVLARTADGQDIHPYYFMLSLGLSLNMAFCLPSGSFINALLIANGTVTIFQLIKTGVVMNIICLVVLNLGVNTYGWWILNLDDVPTWALSANVTSVD
ncbi:Na(+)/dicarboxylate cotransporter 3-like [Ptychodera flava]|uniref:Na(+)/dicarboxylate cotransporter 3-like n=1 Tax=Ptychodera flava TaxID=63121 RepID=UPI00396A09B5